MMQLMLGPNTIIQQHCSRIYSVRKFGFAEVHGIPMCLICQKTIAVLKRANLQRNHEQLHPEFKAAYPLDSDLRRTKLQTLLDGFQAQQSIVRDMVKSSDNVIEASFKIAWNIAKANKPATEGEFLKTTFVDCANSLFSDFKNKDDIIKQILKLQVSDSTGIRRVEVISDNILLQLLKDIESAVFLSIALDESTDAQTLPSL